MFARLFALLAFTFAFATPAFAQAKIATVDLQRAINEVSEGATAKKKLESMMAEKESAIAKMQKNLETMQSELEKQQVILSDAARKQKEEELYMANMQFQQAYQRSQGEMQQAYMGAMETLIGKMKPLVGTIATEKGYTIVIETNEGGVYYSSPTIDITDELIKRYNAANPAAAGTAPKSPTTTAPKK